ncbi:hypothetical protein CF68_04170 [Cupriavidus sp. SK-4]|uniref:phospholipase effector Tle1 domain-containing protein n=1 Tax=Cupriavidus sp. SK-4 TaxID=574750 RepID=UPI00044C187F|nr:DUF2235 domain-containing protein [Cupriavidus sp. SK-4]EYS97736.1 hypothetical protein CF68_04170 [Cupriavidus sp. SK-4]
MTQPVNSPSIRTQYAPAAEYCRLTLEEEDNLDDNRPEALCFRRGAGPNCHHAVNVGLFFDGTNNNMQRDYDDSPPEKRNHSNVVRLYLAHPDIEDNCPENSNQYFRFYMPGVGTPFEQIGEGTETDEGKAFAKGGQARILWAVMQVYNAVHRTAFDDQPMLRPEEMKSLIQDYEDNVDHHQRPDPELAPVNRHEWFKALSDGLSQKLRERLLSKPLPSVPKVTLSVFGFSRGAVEARAFCYWYQDTLQDGKFLGAIDTEIKFLGLFDSVATVGTSASMNAQFSLWMLSGHSSWAAEILTPLPAIVKKTVHLMAAHEIRMNFPLTRVAGNNVEEWLFPGVHSDVGGGYGPGDQGRARRGHASLLSQIPLVHMYRAALVHGVPFVRFDKLKKVVRDDFEVSDALQTTFNFYMQRVRVNKETDFRKVYCRHMQRYYRWRSRMRNAGQGAISRNATTAQDKQDLEKSNNSLLWDLHVLQSRADPNAFLYDRKVALSPQERAGASQMQIVYAEAGYPLTPWERWAMSIFEPRQELRNEQDVYEDAFFENHIHDSLAGFYMAGAVTRYDKEVEFEKMCEARARGSRLNEFQQRIYNQNQLLADARIRALQNGTAKPTKPNEKVPEVPGLNYPLMRDDDAPAMRVLVVRAATSSRREGGGYFRQRWVYMPQARDLENETKDLDPAKAA